MWSTGGQPFPVGALHAGDGRESHRRSHDGFNGLRAYTRGGCHAAVVGADGSAGHPAGHCDTFEQALRATLPDEVALRAAVTDTCLGVRAQLMPTVALTWKGTVRRWTPRWRAVAAVRCCTWSGSRTG